MNTLKQSIITIIVCTAVVAGVSLVYSWTGPTQTPPGGNVDAPINVSDVTQYKSGALGVGGVLHGYSNAIFDGNVGIGAKTPTEKLEIADNFDADFDMLTATSHSPSDISTIHIKRARGSLSAPTIVLNGDNLGAIDAIGYDGSSYNRAAEIYMSVDGTPALNSVPGAMYFSTRSAGDTTSWAGATRMVIRSNGNVGIGTTTPSQKLDVAGYVKGQSGLCIGSDCRTSWTLSCTSVYSGNICGNHASGYATCPSGYIMTGGGYQLAYWDGGNFNAPDESRPQGDTQWKITNGGNVQNSCWQAVVRCCKL
jgi:hypothetical protein